MALFASQQNRMDSEVVRNRRIIDLVDDCWREDELPSDDIAVPVEELPDPEADSADSHLTLKEQSQKWQDIVPNLLEQINIREQLPKYLVSEVKLLTTKCALVEVERIAKKTLGALTILKQFSIHQCGHTEPLTGANCLLSMVGKSNSAHYFIASQDRALQNSLRNIPGVPLIYLHQKAPTLEKPSNASYNIAETAERNLLGRLNEIQEETLTTLKEKSGIVMEETVKRRKKKKGGPNPLSCLKKKTKSNQIQASNSSGRVRKRKRVKLPKHVKETLTSN